MTTATTTPASEPTLIPLDDLYLSPLNVRKTGGADVAALAANIQATGRLLQNLVVIAEPKGKKRYGVVCGGRRLAALVRLAKDKAIAADLAIPCQLVSRAEAVELSASENVHREGMHPADEFEAFAAMVDEGRSIEDIAARHGTTVEQVRRRLLLSRVSPKVLALYREDKIQLDQVMAFTLTTDHAAQEALLAGRRCPSAWEIRRALTTGAVPSREAGARYIGEKAYVAAGGVVRRDMFDERNAAWFEDSGLLARLVTDKLEKTAAKLRGQWPWVEVYPEELDYNIRAGYGPVPTVLATPDAKTAKKLDALREAYEQALTEQRRIEELDGSEEEWELASDKADALHDKIEAIEDGLRVPDPAAQALAGAVVGLTGEGKLHKLEGVIRASDKARLRKTGQTTGNADSADQGSEDEGSQAQADGDGAGVRTDLSVFLTAITQDALANQVGIGLRALAYQLSLRWIGESWNNHGVAVSIEDNAALLRAASLEGSDVRARLDARHDAWKAKLPDNGAALWQWCLSAPEPEIHMLLAYSASRALSGIQMHAGEQKMAPLVAALGIDLVKHWQPCADYFARIKKSATLAILAEHGHADPSLAKMKRDALAGKAADLLAGTGWLPPTLRLPS